MLLSTCRSRRLFALPLAGLALAAVLVLMAGGAQANTIYTYTGVNFDGALSPYTTAMSVHGSIELPLPLGANLVEADLLTGPYEDIAWSFSNGVQTYTNTGPAPPGYELMEITVSTHADGTIADWFMSFGSFSGAQLTSCGVIGSNGSFGDFHCTGQGAGAGRYDLIMVNIVTPSAWSVHAGSWSQVPEPSTGLLVALGLTCLAAKGRRRNRS